MAAGREPLLIPPRGGGGIGDYTLRDFAAKWLVQQEDLAEVERYRAANQALDGDGDERRRIVLFGDSITEFWREADLPAIGGHRLVNRGIAGQNTSQMLLRFEDDVVALNPDAVMVLGGTNDLRSYAGPPSAISDGALARISRNVTAMVDIAAARRIGFVIATLPPVGDQPDVWREPLAVAAVNDWLRRFASQRSLPVADFGATLADPAGMLPHKYSEDGVHPNAAGYRRMAPVLARALHPVTSARAGHSIAASLLGAIATERQA